MTRAVPTREWTDSPYPQDDGLVGCDLALDRSFLFAEVLQDLLPSLRELRPLEIVVVRPEDGWPTRHHLDLCYVYERGGVRHEALADHVCENPAMMFEGASAAETEVVAATCLALHRSVPVVPAERVLPDGPVADVTVDLLAVAEEGTWLRGLADGTPFRCLVPGRAREEFSDPRRVASVERRPDGLLLSFFDEELLILK
jgi:hypothetical protein